MCRRFILSTMAPTTDRGSAIDGLPGLEPAKAALGKGLVHGHPAIFLDYDGTLTPIVDDPNRALLPDATRRTLRRLSAFCLVAIVSGRDLRKLQELVRLDGIVYAGSHGFEIVGPPGSGLDRECGATHLPDLDGMEATLSARLAGLPGVAVERKRFDIAVHTRNARSSGIPDVHNAVEAALASTDRLRLVLGKDVLQIQPNIDWNKGRAVLWLLEALRGDGQGPLPLYIGDDITDEDAFRAVQSDGIGVVVRDDRPRCSAASYALDDPEAVLELLDWLAGELDASSRPSEAIREGS